jgi:type 2 lantibiotic biosynthesis protein LanM
MRSPVARDRPWSSLAGSSTAPMLDSPDFASGDLVPADLDELLKLHGLPWGERLRASAGQRPADRDGDGDDEQALQTWQRLIGRTGRGAFAKRLEWDGLGPDGARHLVECHSRTGDDPVWLGELHTMMAAVAQSALSGEESDASAWWDAIDREIEDALRDNDKPIPYVHAVWPIVEHELRRVQVEVGDHCNVEQWAWNDMGCALAQQLSNVLRSSLNEQRAGTSYRTYCHHFVASGLVPFLREFPVAGRAIATICEYWRHNASLLVRRIEGDRSVLAREFGVEPTSPLSRVEWGLSDPHRGGTSVAILTFGTDAPRVVYKPKDLRLEQEYETFRRTVMTAFDRDGINPRGTDAVMDGRGNEITHVYAVGAQYGYSLLVEHAPCDPERLPEFYRNAGRLMAMLHLLGTSDCHFENLIAHREHLVLIDAETLFEVRLRTDVEQVRDHLPEGMDDWILNLGMLPAPQAFAAGQAAVDISALGVESATGAADTEVRTWLAVNSDDMDRGKVLDVMPQPHSLPVPVGVPNPLTMHADDLIEGFGEMYRWFMKAEHRADLTRALRRFAGLRKRVVLRGTSVYAILQNRASSPQSLRSCLARGFELDRLARSSLVHEQRTTMWDVFHAEVDAMERWDIPYFDIVLGDTHLVETHVSIAGLIDRDGIVEAVDRLSRMSQQDLAWQSSLIGAAVSLSDGPSPASTLREPPVVEAAEILTALRQTSLTDRVGAPTWLVLGVASRSGQMSLELAAPDLYGGQAGIAATLFAQASVSDTADDRSFAEQAMQPLITMLGDDGMRFRNQRDRGLGVAGYGGVLRLLWMLENEGWYPPAADLLAAAVDHIDRDLIARDSSLDVIGGVAGSLGIVASFANRYDTAKDLTAAMAGRLMQAQDAGGGWMLSGVSAGRAGSPLTGLGHGASGMGLALLEAGVALEDEAMVAAGARAFAYEDSVFDADEGNWPDFRLPGDEQSFMLGWCAGAPGIGLARMRALELLPEHPDVLLWRRALELSAEATASLELRPRDHVCCGNFGRATALGLMGRSMQRPEWVATANDLVVSIQARAVQDFGFSLGPGGTARAGYKTPHLMPSFMQGLAGIAFASLVGPSSTALVPLLVGGTNQR